jgi:CheY-like chemotaxis protein/anti-sigma regulatory factor (Ser/Thr protein kinase)
MPDLPKKILIVDDDPGMCLFLWHALKLPDVSVTSCANGRDAERLLTEQAFDLVLLDLGLPDINGLDLLARFKDHNSTRFIIITADTTSETLMLAVRENAYEYVRKPFEAEEIRNVVKKALAAQPLPAIEVISAKPEWFELSLPCSIEAANRIERFMCQLKPDLPEEVRDCVSQCFRELLLNAVEWGGGLDPNRRVRVSCLRTARMVQYRIADPGPGFRFEDLAHAAVANAPGEAVAHDTVRETKGLRPGGFGILMARAMCDELLYNEAQNEVLLIKYLG